MQRLGMRMITSIRGVAALVLALGAMVGATGCAARPPKFQPGLWEVRGQALENQGSKRTDFAFKLCRDRNYDAAQTTAIERRPGCSTRVVKTGPQQYTSSSTCIVSGIAIDSQGVTTYLGDKGVHSETRAVFKPALNGKTDETITQDQVLVSACPTGMRPGDVMGADGFIRHQEDPG